MESHQDINDRALMLARRVVEYIDADPEHKGIDRAHGNCKRWIKRNDSPAISEWLDILKRPWNEIRSILLMESEEGNRLRQSTPFCGIISPRERWDIYRKARRHAAQSA
jgi:hypothetical protein